MAAIDSQAATMGRELFYLPDAEPRGFEDANDGMEREVGEMFVIDRIELCLFDELHQMREFQRDCATRLEGGF